MASLSHSKLLPLLLVCAALCYLPSLSFPLLEGWDDPTYILDNAERLTPSLTNVQRFLEAPYFNNYHPVTMLSYMVDFSIGRTNAFVYRLQNLLWHLIACAGLYACLCRFGIGRSLSWFLALLWAVHPQRVESVVWVSERKDVLCGAFIFWALWCYTRQPARYTAAFLLFLLAILSKAMVVTFVGVLALMEWSKHDGRLGWQSVKRLLPYACLSVVMAAATVNAQGEAVRANVPLLRRLPAAVWNTVWYVCRTLVPTDLCPMYPRIDPHAAALLAVLIAPLCLGSAVTLWRLSRNPIRRHRCIQIVSGLLAYPTVLAPVCGLVPLAFIDRADRYSYLPSAVLLWLLGRLAQGAWESERVKAFRSRIPKQRLATGMGLAATVIAATLMWQTYLYARVWQSYTSVLYTAYLVDRPHPRVIGALAEALLEAKEGAAVWRLAGELEASDRPYLSSGQREAHEMKAAFLRAAVLEMDGELAGAALCLEDIDRRVRNGDTSTFLDPRRYCHMKAGIEMRLERFEQAIASYTQLLRRHPNDGPAYLGRGRAHHRLEQLELALADFLQAQALDPYSSQAAEGIRQAQVAMESVESGPARNAGAVPTKEP